MRTPNKNYTGDICAALRRTEAACLTSMLSSGRGSEHQISEAAAAILGPKLQLTDWGGTWTVERLSTGAESRVCRRRPVEETRALEKVEVSDLPGTASGVLRRCRGNPVVVLAPTTGLVGAESVSESAVKEIGVPSCGYAGAEVALGLGW
ncbi:hypothetical protein NDU88_006590 [Pleurodeles waltl]|uniref:Uncharacterized protein n=1 Tax=Pleurodeles waltl TaxID=8319 RepID=A0AAV7WY06_PLEWA|nr:hypothetical protein NDU88_006590 [Pleurodeles waltl]